MTWEERCYRQAKERRTSCSPSSSRPLSGEFTLQSACECVSTTLLLCFDWTRQMITHLHTTGGLFGRILACMYCICNIVWVCVSGGCHHTGVGGCAIPVPRPGRVFQWQAQWLQPEHALQRCRATLTHTKRLFPMIFWLLFLNVLHLINMYLLCFGSQHHQDIWGHENSQNWDGKFTNVQQGAELSSLFAMTKYICISCIIIIVYLLQRIIKIIVIII